MPPPWKRPRTVPLRISLSLSLFLVCSAPALPLPLERHQQSALADPRAPVRRRRGNGARCYLEPNAASRCFFFFLRPWISNRRGEEALISVAGPSEGPSPPPVLPPTLVSPDIRGKRQTKQRGRDSRATGRPYPAGVWTPDMIRRWLFLLAGISPVLQSHFRGRTKSLRH